jgi:hypothetical protein
LAELSKKKKRDHGSFDITIAAAPGGGLGLDHEIRLIKCGLLYADHVTLCSPKASMLLAVEGLKKLTIAEQVALVTQIAPILRPDEAEGFLTLGAGYEQLRRGRNLSREALLMRGQIESRIRSAW